MPADTSSSVDAAAPPATAAVETSRNGTAPRRSPPAPLRPPLFADLEELTAGFSTRAGGLSEGAYASLNLGFSTDDEAARVLENRRRLGDAVGFPPEQWVVAGQVHGDRILQADEAGLFRGYDGLVTDRAGLLLCISAADCAAILLADPEAGVIGACHSGWRGTVERISEKTVAEMESLGARPARIFAYVSPCISAENFEVGEEVAEQFDAQFVRRPADFPQQQKPHVDLKAAIETQLRSAGLPSEQIEVSPHCTVGACDTLFSYRAGDGVTGRMMGFIGRRP